MAYLRTITVGGNGYNPALLTPSSFVYSGNPSDFQFVDDVQFGASQADIRMLMSTGGGTAPGFIDDVIAAIHTVSNVPYPCPDIQPVN